MNCDVCCSSLVQPSSRQPVAFSADIDDVGLTDIEVANGIEYDDNFDDDRVYEMEYEVSNPLGATYINITSSIAPNGFSLWLC